MNKYAGSLLVILVVMVAGCSPQAERPENAFLDSTLILRPGVADAGDMTVRKFVDRLSMLPQPDGSPAKIIGWERSDQGYILNAKVAATFQVPFVWSKTEKLALLQYAEVDGERLSGMQFFMLTMSMKPITAPSPPSNPAPIPEVVAAAETTQQKGAEASASATKPEISEEHFGEMHTNPVVQPNMTTVANGPEMTVPHLCTEQETPIFACSTGKKRASVCSSKNGSQLVYRLAPLEGVTEMEYPSAGANASAAFKYGVQTATDGVDVTFLSFDKGNYRYAVYGSATSAAPQGIVVEQSGKRIADLRCQAERWSSLEGESLKRMGLSEDHRPLPRRLSATY